MPVRHLAPILLAAFGIAACASPTDLSWHSEAGYRWRALDVPARGRAGFTLLTAPSTGLTHRNDVTDEHALANRNLLIGAGVALGDVNGDGLSDVFLASVEQPPALYRNDGGFHFTDITAESGIERRGLATTGAVFADVDGDRALDLLVGTLGGPLRLWLGDGKGHFRDATATSGLIGGYAATTLTLADVDGDGDLDLYVATYKTRNALDVYPPRARAFDRIARKVGGRYVVADTWQAEYRVEDRPDLGGVISSQRAEPDLFFLNDGRGHFARTLLLSPRFRDEEGKGLVQEPDYFTLAARFYDVNGDGAPDLYVCNDFDDPDQFWINDGRGGFTLVPWPAVRATSNACMSVDFADVNRDGHVDVFTADMMSPTLAARQRQFPTHMPLPKTVGLTRDRPQWMRNALLLSRGDGTWASIADFAGVAATDWTWGSAFLDVDLDGYEDLLAVNGHRWDIRDADTFERLRHRPVPWNREQGEFPRLATRSVALRNQGDLTFEDASARWKFGVDETISQGIALADLDGDGDLDVVVTRLDAPPVVYRNESTAPRIAVQLAGAPPNTAGVGAVVTVRARGLPVQSREMTAGGYYLSGSEERLMFATSRDSQPTLEVRWRSGRVSTLTGIRPNRLYVVEESSAAPPPTLAPAADSTLALFEDATSLLGGHTHVDSLFDDYQRQPLLPNRFSQLGPGLSWIDVDGDGREDLVVGSGRGGRLTVLRQVGARFTPVAAVGSPLRLDLTTIVPVPDGGGGLTLLAGQSNYESSTIADALAAASVLQFPLRHGAPPLLAAAPLLPPDTASVGPLALGDVDGDGRLDLFVGARVVPGAWPLPAPSRLYHRASDGAWVRDTVNARVLASLGLVSSAIFTDLDGDGRQDLVATAEWGPLRILHNDSAHLRDVTREWGVAGRTSRWNGVAAGDFDGDGRIDLVVTSWGRNIPWHASPDRPYELVVGNFGGAGLGLVFAQRDSASGREMPLESFERLGVAIPSVRKRFATFTAYAQAAVDDVLGDGSRSAIRVGATTFDNTVLLNRGDHFEVRALPTAAQLAPAFAPVVADFDGDGREDLFLSQNFFATELGTPRFDAGAGLLLLGDGTGGFRALSVQQSGIRILGDQRGAAVADYDGDGRVDLAVSQNGGRTTLWHNHAGTPGLRVRLNGGTDNPLAVGARMRMLAGTVRGPIREIRAGGGYWSMDAPTTVLALPARASALWLRWPDGMEETIPLSVNQREVTKSAVRHGRMQATTRVPDVDEAHAAQQKPRRSPG